MRAEEIQRRLERLRNVSQDIEAAALISSEGFIMASVLPESLEEEQIAALSAGFMGMAERCSGEMGKGSPRQLFINTQDGLILMMGIGQDAYLTVLASGNGKPGLILYDMKRAAEDIKGLL